DGKDRWIILRLADVIRFFVVTLGDVDALRRAFFFADFAGHTSQSSVRVIAVINQERKITIVLGQGLAFFRILHCDQTILLEITSDEVPQRHRHTVEYAKSDHLVTRVTKVTSLHWKISSSTRSEERRVGKE